MEVTIEGTTYPIKMNMLAIREYKKLTGKNLIGKKALEEIFGSSKDAGGGDFDADLFLNFLYVLLVNGAYPEAPNITIDQLANIVSFSDVKLAKMITICWISSQTGQNPEELSKDLEETVKNRQSPQDGEKTKDQTILDGSKSNASPLGS